MTAKVAVSAQLALDFGNASIWRPCADNARRIGLIARRLDVNTTA